MKSGQRAMTLNMLRQNADTFVLLYFGRIIKSSAPLIIKNSYDII